MLNEGAASNGSDPVARFFRFEELGTGYRNEILGGITTFITMAYIIVVNPAILAAAGIPIGPSTVATILAAVVGTLIMGLYARRPIGVAPYMGENAFIAFTVVLAMGFTWQQGLTLTGRNSFEIIWDGKDDKGENVPYGIYIARLEVRFKVSPFNERDNISIVVIR